MAGAEAINFVFTGNASGALGAIDRVNAGLAELDWSGVWTADEAARGMMEMVLAGRQCQKAMTKQRAVKRWNRKRRRR